MMTLAIMMVRRVNILIINGFFRIFNRFYQLNIFIIIFNTNTTIIFIQYRRWN